MKMPDFSLENWQRQGLYEYIFVRSDQSAFDQIGMNAKSDPELLVAALAVGVVIEDDVPAMIAHFERELNIPGLWLNLCVAHMKSCLDQNGASGREPTV